MCYSSKKIIKKNLVQRNVLVVFCLALAQSAVSKWYLPVQTEDRVSLQSLRLTPIGKFGLLRKARKGIPEHLHTGIDIVRPNANYTDEPIFPASEGIVISMRDDGPFSQIIIEHKDELYGKIWTVYEHVSGIRCTIGQKVFPQDTIAQFFPRDELNRYGWQFDHLHFEVMKAHPLPVEYRKRLPSFRYTTYALTCYTIELLHQRMIDPMTLFKQ